MSMFGQSKTESTTYYLHLLRDQCMEGHHYLFAHRSGSRYVQQPGGEERRRSELRLRVIALIRVGLDPRPGLPCNLTPV